MEWKEIVSAPTPEGPAKGGHGMLRNRITMNEHEPIHLPQQPTPPLNTCGFVLVAVPVTSMQQWTVQQWLYQRAFELAQAVVRPSIIERDLLGVWN